MDGNGCTIECPMNNLYVECSYTESVFSVFHSEKNWKGLDKKQFSLGDLSWSWSRSLKKCLVRHSEKVRRQRIQIKSDDQFARDYLHEQFFWLFLPYKSSQSQICAQADKTLYTWEGYGEIFRWLCENVAVAVWGSCRALREARVDESHNRDILRFLQF